MKLAEVSRALGGGEMPVRVVTKVVTDSREDCTGGLFFALRGPNYDGHRFVEDAFIAGAVSAVVQKGTGNYSRAVIEVRDTGEALLQLAAYYRRRQDVKVVGITGSVGKTTCKDMAALVLGSMYKTVKTQGNLNNKIGLPKTIFQIEDDTRMAVLEMGMSEPGEISLLSHVAQPDVAIITEIGVSHLESMKTRDNILRAKLEIVQGLPPGGILIVNADNDMLSHYIQEAHSNVVRVGIRGENLDIYATDIVEENWKTTFTITSAFGTVRTYIPLMGEHNVRNALLAFTAGGVMGVKKEQAAQALTQYEPSGMRNRVYEKNGLTIIEDCYNASPDSMKVALEMLSRLQTDGRKIAVLGDMLELGQLSQFYHEQVGAQVVDNGIDYLLCFGDQAQFIVFKAQRQGMKNAEYFTSRTDLKVRLRRLVREGDTVLFKASRGMKFEEIVDSFE